MTWGVGEKAETARSVRDARDQVTLSTRGEGRVERGIKEKNSRGPQGIGKKEAGRRDVAPLKDFRKRGGGVGQTRGKRHGSGRT